MLTSKWQLIVAKQERRLSFSSPLFGLSKRVKANQSENLSRCHSHNPSHHINLHEFQSTLLGCTTIIISFHVSFYLISSPKIRWTSPIKNAPVELTLLSRHADSQQYKDLTSSTKVTVCDCVFLYLLLLLPLLPKNCSL